MDKKARQALREKVVVYLLDADTAVEQAVVVAWAGEASVGEGDGFVEELEGMVQDGLIRWDGTSYSLHSEGRKLAARARKKADKAEKGAPSSPVAEAAAAEPAATGATGDEEAPHAEPTFVFTPAEVAAARAQAGQDHDDPHGHEHAREPEPPAQDHAHPHAHEHARPAEPAHDHAHPHAHEHEAPRPRPRPTPPKAAAPKAPAPPPPRAGLRSLLRTAIRKLLRMDY